MQRNYADNYSDPSSSVNISGHVKGNMGTLSPYLNFDPRSLPPSQPQYILPEGSDGHRGMLAYSFSTIASSWVVGGVAGGAAGLYNGYNLTSQAGLTGKPRVTQLLNYTVKTGGATGQKCGVIAVIFSGIASAINFVRQADDEFNTVAAATLTGCIFASPGGLRKSAYGGAIGLSLALIFCLSQSQRKFLQLKEQRSPY